MSNPVAADLPPERLRTIDPICDAFELAWKQGRRPAIEEYLGSATDALRELLLAELIRTELEWRYRLGEVPDGQEYRTRFPACAGRIDDWRSEARSSAEQVSACPSAETDDAGLFRTSSVQPGDLSPASPMPPQVLGEYELLEKLGAGGMGEVHRARHRRLDKLVALKLLSADSRECKDRLSRFLREMKAVGSLDHPNLVEAYDAGEHAGVVYLVMKLIEGTDLGKLVRQRGPLPIPEACDLARQTALGLGYLHERGLVHRDLKPSNLMRTPDGTVKILDLGLARWRAAAASGDDLTGPGQVMGTPDFLAPEQLRSAAMVDIRADLYGLGGTLFYLLTGQAPFAHRQGLYEKLDAHEREQPPDVRSLRPEVSDALAELVKRLLAKKPVDRPQTPAEVAAALAAIAAAEEDGTPALESRLQPAKAGTLAEARSTALESRPQPAKAGTPTPPQPRRPWLSTARRRWLVAGAGILIPLLGLVMLLDWRHRREVSPSDMALPGNPPPTPPKVEIESLDVKHVGNRQGQLREIGLLGERSFDALRDDLVNVEARLSRPAHAYLICFRPDGEEDLCFPQSKDQPPPLTDRPSYPPPDKKGEYYELHEGTGLWVFAVVVSRQPLPAYEVWKARRRPSPWKAAAVATPGVVWKVNGTEVEPLLEELGVTRGKGREVEGKGTMVQLTDWLRQSPDVDAMAALGFVVLPRKEP
jgi:serine/threonine protein kinase